MTEYELRAAVETLAERCRELLAECERLFRTSEWIACAVELPPFDKAVLGNFSGEIQWCRRTRYDYWLVTGYNSYEDKHGPSHWFVPPPTP